MKVDNILLTLIMSSFLKWLDTFIEEKKLESVLFTIEYNNNVHFIESDFVLELIKTASEIEQIKIKNMLVKLDFYNANIYNYLEHLARGGQRRATDDIVTASIYTSRSATFSELKSEVSKAFGGEDWAEMKKNCQAIMDKHAEIASLWQINPESFKVQNLKVYKDLLEAHFGDDISDATKTKNIHLNAKVLGDAETRRVPWQVGKSGQFGGDIEPLDEGFVHEILTGEKSESPMIIDSTEKAQTMATTVIDTTVEDFMQFKSMSLEFVTSMQEALSAEEVCDILNVPVSAMRVFVKALNPTFVWEDLGKNFKSTIWGLLNNRSGRLESCPVKKLLELVGDTQKLQIDG